MNYEYESTVTIQLKDSKLYNYFLTSSSSSSSLSSSSSDDDNDDDDYKRFDSIFFSFKKNCKKDILFYFNNGLRLANRKLENKITLENKNVLFFFKNKFFPIIRSVSSETQFFFNKNDDDNDDDNNNDDDDDDDDENFFFNIIKSTYRFILYNENNLRLCVNKNSCEYGSNYTLTCEIEYKKNYNYKDIYKAEKLMFDKFCNIFLFLSDFKKENVSLDFLFACIVPKVQVWDCFNFKKYNSDKNLKWAFKWDGIKAKMLINENLNVYLWPDADEVQQLTVVFKSDIKKLNFLKNLCLQVELMSDCIIIVHVIAAIYQNNELFFLEPFLNLKVLNFIEKKIKTPIFFKYKTNRLKLVVQKFFNYTKTPIPLSSSSSSSLSLQQKKKKCEYDGFIFIQNNLIIKWKLPTIDVKCIAPCVFLVGKKEKIYLKHGNFAKTGCIYELSNEFKILRKRKDRLTCSTDNEYKIFLKSIKNIKYNDKNKK